MIELNEALFEQYTRESDIPVLVEFWAPWCGYCRRISAAMEAVEKRYAGKLLVAGVNVDKEPILEDREKIELIPTLVIYHRGKALDALVAPESRGRIEAFLAEHLPKTE